jgi:VWFA-related protein
MKHAVSFLAAGIVATAVLSAQDPQAPKGSDARTRQVYVSVVDSNGVAVPGLGPADFTVREDGQSREVLRATQATEPLDIVLLVDDSQAATTSIPYLRTGLTKFVEQLAGKGAIGVVTIGERPTSIVERTTDVAALKKGILRIFARPGSGAYLLDAIVEVSRGFQKRETARPTIVAITIEGIEFSNLQYERVLDELHRSGAALHVLAVGRARGDMSDEIRSKNIVMARGTETTGGRRDQLLSELSIPDALSKMAGELLNQYVVTYGRPDALIPPEKIEVSVKKPGLTARARTRVDTR